MPRTARRDPRTANCEPRTANREPRTANRESCLFHMRQFRAPRPRARRAGRALTSSRSASIASGVPMLAERAAAEARRRRVRIGAHHSPCWNANVNASTALGVFDDRRALRLPPRILRERASLHVPQQKAEERRRALVRVASISLASVSRVRPVAVVSARKQNRRRFVAAVHA